MAQRPDIKIECRNISKHFITEQYTINVLDDVSLKVEENEFVVVLGPGQCGKTIAAQLHGRNHHARRRQSLNGRPGGDGARP